MTRFLAVLPVLLGCAAAQCSLSVLPAYGAGNIVRNVGPAAVTAVASWQGQVIVGGNFDRIDGVVTRRIARWDGNAWHPLGGGTPNGVNAAVRTMGTLPNGDLFVGGEFWEVHGTPRTGVARWNGQNWSGFGSGIAGQVYAHCLMPSGDLVVGGSFTSAGGTPAQRVARWDGTAWHALGSGFDAQVNCLLTMPNGDVIAGGMFQNAGATAASRIARWDGSSWQPFGSGANSTVEDLALRPSGDVIAVGAFSMMNGVSAQRLARWDGSAWHALGGSTNGVPSAMTDLPDGSLGIVGNFSLIGGVPAVGAARWNDSSLTALGALSFSGGSAPRTCAVAPNGELLLGGGWTNAGPTGSPYLIRLASTCPAAATALAAGCPSSGGSNAMTSTPPWLGGTAVTTGAGLPSNALVLLVLGFATQSTPLSALLPQGGAGCVANVSSDAVVALPATAGTVRFETTMPLTPALNGVTYHQQMFPVELGAQGQVVALTATNALSLTTGVF